jgi:hypothetical protein
MLRTKKKTLVPDPTEWRRLHTAGTILERPEDVPKIMGTAVFSFVGADKPLLIQKNIVGFIVCFLMCFKDMH